MAYYTYQARDSFGKTVKGVIEARDQKQALGVIRERGLYTLEITERKQKHGLTINTFLRRVTFGEVTTFTRQLAAMVTAGLQLPQALAILQAQETNQQFATVQQQIMRDIESGSSLGTALEKHPKVFSRTYLSLVKAGESSGTLDKVLERLATNMEKDKEFRSKVSGALVYPGIVLTVMAVVGAVLMIFVIPQITQLYSDFGFELPLTTRILIATSNFMVHFWWLLIIGAIGAVYGFRKFKDTPAGKRSIDNILLSIPVIGSLIKHVILVEFTRTLGMLVAAGIHLLDALTILTDSMTNILYHEALEDIAKKVEKGSPLGAAFAQYEIFPAILPQMIKVGEETGKMDEVLIKLSVYFENESSQVIKSLTTIIEPLIMVVLGIGVGFIVLSIITPIYELTGSF